MDYLRIDPRLGDGADFDALVAACRNHDVTRVASQVRDPRHRAHAVALLCFLPGVPSIYYGDELGLEAVKEDRRTATTPYAPSCRPSGTGSTTRTRRWSSSTGS